MSQKLTGAEIRERFLKFFEEKGHRRVRSSNLVPSADPTLLFTNAGMVPFKDLFLGREKRDYTRAVSCQKCLRVSGKHNDLEEVGRTNRHNTFFEMLGNFSFGDYFKEDAIKYGWEFLTETVNLPKDKLWVTVFRDDDEAADLWPRVTDISPDRIVRLGEEDNFWSMGATGPCGPCSEIHIDHGKEFGCDKPDCAPGCDCDRYEEIWNLVFMQYDRDETGKLTPLPNPSIDTGMGLERLASILQGVPSNFDTDLIRPVIAAAEDVLGVTYGDSKENDISLRVIGDHLRTAAFLITEGILPSNDDRGYVLRRIMRRAMRHGKMLGAKEPFLYKVVGSVIDNFRETYPELTQAEESMARIIQVEEQRFGRTLETGLKLLNDLVASARKNNSDKVDGHEIFKLYDTYGFPIDLAEDVLNDAGLTYSREEYNDEFEKQREKARKAAKTAPAKVAEAYAGLEGQKTEFTGYANTEDTGTVMAIIVEGKRADSLAKGQSGEIILDRTPFYGESGGQAGDNGTLSGESGFALVTDAKKPVPDVISHHVTVTDGEIKTGDILEAKVDADRRGAIRRNHTATHLLQSALKQVLGEHVKQSGSYVGPDKLRFDFSHYAPADSKELKAVEELINEKVRENISLATREMDTEQAITEGATALFGEKYGASVRVVDVPGFSRELCGGTHVDGTGEIGLFKILNETGVAAGIRRIEAVTGGGAYKKLREMEDELADISSALKCKPEFAPERVFKLVEQNRELEKQLKKLKQEMASGGAGAGFKDEKDIGGVKVLAQAYEGMDTDTLRNLVDETKGKIKSGVVLAGSVDGEKVILIAGVTKDLVKKLHAGKIAKAAAQIVGGGGGGRPDMAQAGGSDPSKINEALMSVFRSVEQQLG